MELPQLMCSQSSYGFSYVDGCPVSPSATQALLERIAFIRPTHYGTSTSYSFSRVTNRYTRRLLGLHIRSFIKRYSLHVARSRRPYRHDILHRPSWPPDVPLALAHGRGGRRIPVSRRIQSCRTASPRIPRSIRNPLNRTNRYTREWER